MVLLADCIDSTWAYRTGKYERKIVYRLSHAPANEWETRPPEDKSDF